MSFMVIIYLQSTCKHIWRFKTIIVNRGSRFEEVKGPFNHN